ncbi:hypothetical protein [Gracilimonas tropica]|uniref:hypothetical protein n=1 Tax=Gracilimonas tropica TaxID=454600 RepID=UPI0003813C53|nr:hypothetical protein [Gracilimonas tropica]
MTALKADESLPCFSLPKGNTFELNGEPFQVDSVTNLVFNFHQNNTTGYIRLSYSEEASYNKFMTVIDRAKQGYEDWRDQKVLEVYKQSYLELTDEEKDKVQQQFPYRMKVDSLNCDAKW